MRIGPINRTLVITTAGLLCGVAYGGFTEWIEEVHDNPAWYEAWHGLLPWGLVTLGVGYTHGAPLRRAAITGFATQLGLVVGYYAAVGEIDTLQLAAYGTGAILFGPLYGAAGAELRHREPQPWAVGLAAAPALIDGLHQLLEAADPDWTVSHHLPEMRAVGIASVTLTIILLVGLARPWRDRLTAALLAGGLGAVFVALLQAGVLD